MLKKTVIAAAVAAGALLAASPFAFAADVDQERHQHSFKGNGVGEGNQGGHGNSENPDTVFCNINGQGGNNFANDSGPGQSFSSPGQGDPCDNVGATEGQKTEQYAENDDDEGGSYDKRHFDFGDHSAHSAPAAPAAPAFPAP